MQIRGCDKWGCGHFGASRGNRKHNGVDIIWTAGKPFHALTQGVVTKLGYAYADDLSFRYVELTDRVGARWRYFYVKPSVELGEEINAYEDIGVVQTLQNRYPEIVDHVHFEIIRADGTYVDPTGIVMDR